MGIACFHSPERSAARAEEFFFGIVGRLPLDHHLARFHPIDKGTRCTYCNCNQYSSAGDHAEGGAKSKHDARAYGPAQNCAAGSDERNKSWPQERDAYPLLMARARVRAAHPSPPAATPMSSAICMTSSCAEAVLRSITIISA